MNFVATTICKSRWNVGMLKCSMCWRPSLGCGTEPSHTKHLRKACDLSGNLDKTRSQQIGDIIVRDGFRLI